MTRFFTRWAIGAVALYLTVLLGERFGFHLSFAANSTGQSIAGAFVAVLALTLVNALVRPIVAFLALPLSCLTFGLFGLVINALMFYLVGEMNIGLEVKDFYAALYGSVVTSVLFGVLNTFFGGDKKDDK